MVAKGERVRDSISAASDDLDERVSREWMKTIGSLRLARATLKISTHGRHSLVVIAVSYGDAIKMSRPPLKQGNDSARRYHRADKHRKYVDILSLIAGDSNASGEYRRQQMRKKDLKMNNLSPRRCIRTPLVSFRLLLFSSR